MAKNNRNQTDRPVADTKPDGADESKSSELAQAEQNKHEVHTGPQTELAGEVVAANPDNPTALATNQASNTKGDDVVTAGPTPAEAGKIDTTLDELTRTSDPFPGDPAAAADRSVVHKDPNTNTPTVEDTSGPRVDRVAAATVDVEKLLAGQESGGVRPPANRPVFRRISDKLKASRSVDRGHRDYRWALRRRLLKMSENNPMLTLLEDEDIDEIITEFAKNQVKDLVQRSFGNIDPKEIIDGEQKSVAIEEQAEKAE